MSTENPNHSRVLHTATEGRAAAEGLVKLESICAAGAQCQGVQGSPAALAALQDLTAAVVAARESLTSKLAAVTAAQTAAKALRISFARAVAALRFYEAAVRRIAGGDGVLINEAGLLARGAEPPAPLEAVSVLHGRPGKHPGEAILTWPAAGGATSYAVEVSFSPADLQGPFTALSSGTGRRRVVRAPAPGAQILARVAAVDADGTRSAWTSPILVTAA